MLPVIAMPQIASLIAAVTRVATTVGPMIVKNASLLLEVASKSLPQIIKTIETVSAVINIIRPNETAEELGAKAMKADKKPEDFDEINAYIDYLREEVKVEKDELSEETVDVMARQAIGVSLMVKGVSEKIGAELTMPFLKTVSETRLDASVILEMIKLYSSNGLNMDDYDKYLGKALSIEQLDKHSEVLVEAYQKANPTMSTEQAEDIVMGLELPKDCL
ncbi:hypothetical protein [Photobacterium alginatilyticum]|uniref:hypothetical protein n=1 Tax=Photobacterium alginatilyticum TaxID=1775171 RepID=UPI0018656DA9|nr:hypothetical protein [Photobacterium alginatilyticum]